MHWISLETAMHVTGLARRTVWRRVAGNPEWKRNLNEPLKRVQIAVEALRDDLLFPLADEDQRILSAADQRDPEAMNDLALMLLEAERPERAVLWLERAAEAGHADAMHWLGRCLVAGEGVASNTELGLDWLRRSATAGHVISRGMIWQVQNAGQGPVDARAAQS